MNQQKNLEKMKKDVLIGIILGIEYANKNTKKILDSANSNYDGKL